jgi:3-oxoacyl-(acyl-carrier-protein) synthase
MRVLARRALTWPLGASGAIEAAICALAIQRGYLPDTANLSDSDPDLGIRHVPAGGVCIWPDVVLSNSFGGVDAALLLGKPRRSQCCAYRACLARSDSRATS